MFPLSDTLASLGPALAAAGVPRQGLAAVLEAARGLPASLTRCVYLEQWLHVATARLDLIVQVERARREQFARLARERAATDPGWERVAAFARAWSEEGGALDRGAAGAWLEFDLAPETDPARVVPRVFVDFERERLAHVSAADLLELVLAALHPLRAPAKATLAALGRCVDVLPQGATLPYLGVDVSGATAAVRLCVRGLGSGLAEFLLRAGWTGDVEDLATRLLEPLARAQGGPEATRPLLHLDVARDPAPRLGLEYAFARECQLAGRLAETDLLDLLERQSWCPPGVTRGLRRWPGQTIELLPHQIWHSRVARRVNHVKLTYATGEALGVKAYLCVYHELLSDGTLVGGRPRHFGAIPPFRARTPAPSPGAGVPSRALVETRQPVKAPLAPSVGLGTHIAYRWQRGGHTMTMTAKEQQVLEAVLQRSVSDYEFRQRLLHDPRHAIHEALGIVVPANFRVKFIEKDKNVDALVVLPNFQCTTGELSEDDLETVAGGGGGRQTDPDWGDVP